MLPKGKVLKQKKRPLGRIEAEHRYKPPQPVLSCRTVDVDLAGTRTYRAKSADDIIEEQHKIIHNVYNKARNAKSAPTARNKIRYSVDSNWRTLRFLTIEGQNSPNPSTRVSYKGLAAGRPKKRPSTTGSVRANVKSLTDCHFEPSVYIDFEESSRVSKSVGSLVREQWTPKNHSLDEGQFIRGKTKESGASLDPKTGNQWLTFGGGESEESFGVVDAFVDMRNDVFYRVDGSTGVHVAKQLNKGDKIRICRNGTVVSEDTNPSPTGMVSQSSAAESFQSNARISNPLSTASRGKIPVPLCWTDEVKGSNAKILTARESRQTSARSNLNESKPVVFNDVGNDENWRDYLPKGDGLVGKDLYDIRSRSKPRIGLDGQPIRNSKITNLTIDKSKHHEAAEDVADLSVEDILEKHLHIKGEYKPKRHTQHLEAAIASPRRPEDSTHNAKKGDRELVSPTRSVAGRVHSPSLGSRQEYSVIPSRSMTPHDLNSLVVRNSNSENSSEIETKPHTINVPKRAGIAKQPLHKTNAAKGVTFAAGYKGVDTSYIQITKKISMYKDTVKADAQSNHGSSSDDSSTVIQSVLDENKTDYFGTTTEDPDSKNKEETLEEPPVKVVDEASDELPPSPPTVQVPTRKSNQSSDSQYTINIPTAQEAESDIYFQ